MDAFEWKELSPGFWSRSLDTTEDYFIKLGAMSQAIGRETGMLSIALTIKTSKPSLFVSAARQAWKATRYNCPQLATTTSDGKRYYRIADQQEMDSWLRETFVVYDQLDLYGVKNAQGLISLLRPADRAILHVLPGTTEIILQASHDRMDGFVKPFVLNQLLKFINDPPDDPVFGDEAKSLAPPLRLAAAICEATEEQWNRSTNALNKWIESIPINGVASINHGHMPGNSRVQRLQFSTQETSKIVAAARQNGWSLTHVFEASAATAASEHGGHSEIKYLSFGIFSLRDQVNPKYQAAISPYITLVPLIAAGTSFESIVRQLKDFYRGWKAEKKELIALNEPTLQTMFKVFSQLSDGPNTMLSLSNLGQFDPILTSRHDSIELTDMWTLYEMPYAGVNAFLWTREGRLTLNVCYNEAFHEEMSITRFLEATKAILYKGLGLASGDKDREVTVDGVAE